MNIRILSKVWIFLLVATIQVDVNEAFFGSFVKHVKNLGETFHKAVTSITSSGGNPTSSTVNAASSPTSKKFISVQDSLDAAWASRVAYWKKDFDEFVHDTTYEIKDIIDSDDEDLQAFVAESTTGQPTRIISFRGTKSGNQLAEQFIKGLINTYKDNNVYTIGGREVRVLSFIMNGYGKLIDGLVPYITDPSFKYIITGHSMGGSLASLFALKAKIDYPKVWENSESCLITFGAPRLGNTAFANLHDELICPDRKIRIVYRADPAPHAVVTIGNDDFVHHSREVWITTKYFMGLESKRWWQKAPVNPALKICKNLDPTDCSNRLSWSTLAISTSHHRTTNYIDSLKNIPSLIYDKDGNTQPTWEAALTSSNE